MEIRELERWAALTRRLHTVVDAAEERRSAA